MRSRSIFIGGRQASIIRISTGRRGLEMSCVDFALFTKISPGLSVAWFNALFAALSTH